MLTGGTLFSGIGAPECSAPDIDWRWRSEIDPFASAVHKARFPGVSNFGDVTEIDPDAVEPVDLVVFGSPCQSFSVAGKRLGLDDPRGNLALLALGLLDRLKPRWIVFENVPGLLSSNGGRDFGAFLGLLAECGYGYAYRILDAQHFGVPQRRRRVFVVGYRGDWRPAAAVLFEPESLRGDSAPRREAGEGVARPVASSPEGGSSYRNDTDTADNLIAGTVGTENVRHTTGMESGGDLLIAHSLRADGFDASEDGTGRGTPIVPIDTMNAIKPRIGNADMPHAVAYDTTQITSKTNRSQPKAGDPCHPLAAGAHAPAVALRLGGDYSDPYVSVDDQAFLAANPMTDRQMAVHDGRVPGMSVRRLTPTECERLQGFPDGWTRITWRGKPAADGPRYRALGNSMAVPVVRWLLGRIAAFEAMS